MTVTGLAKRNPLGSRRTLGPTTAVPTFSPDGRYVAFATARWDSLEHDDLALMELGEPHAGGSASTVRPLVRDSGFQRFPRWSPDGPRVAYVHTSFRTESTHVCWVTIDRTVRRCLPAPSQGSVELHAWDGPGAVIGHVSDGRRSTLFRLDVDSNRVIPIDSGVHGFWSVSPDGRWGVRLRQRPNDADPTLTVFPLDRRYLTKDLTFGATPLSHARLVWLRREPARYRDRLVIGLPPGGVALGASHVLRARGLDSAGREIDVRVVRWASGDTSVAVIDAETGRLIPRRAGVVRITASAGGWRTADSLVRVVPGSWQVIDRERWDDRWLSRWHPFGLPRPGVGRSARGTAVFLNNGDGSYRSGAYTTQEYAAHDGLGIDVVVATPVTRGNQQRVMVGLTTDLDSARRARWDHETGDTPRVLTDGREINTCAFEFPGGESELALTRLSLSSALRATRLPAPVHLASGRPYRVRVQLFPDGRCGFALDGTPVWIGDMPVSFGRPFRLDISGHARGTRIEVDSIVTWRGIRPDIDWLAFERRAARAGER